MENLEDLRLKCQVFDKMCNLKFLCIHGPNKLHLPDGLNYLPDKLRILQWPRYPLKELPSNFNPENLVELNLSGSSVEQFPEGFRWINLRSCERLTRIPNLAYFLSLEKVKLAGCRSLVDFPSSLQQLNNLWYLSLYGCSNVTKFPLTSGNIENLILSETAIQEVPSSIQSLTKLIRLDLYNCNLMEIPEDIGCLSSLKELLLGGSKFESLPKSIKHLSKLEYLSIRECNMLRSLTELPVALKRLDAINCKQLCQPLPDASEFKLFIHYKCHQYVHFFFTNCFNLDHKALSNVFEESLKGSEEPPTQFSIYLPGSEIPEWFTYQSPESCMCVNIPVLRQTLVNRKFMGFAICVVLGIEEYCGYHNFLDVGVYCHSETWCCSFSEFYSPSQNLEMLLAFSGDSDYVDISFDFKARFPEIFEKQVEGEVTDLMITRRKWNHILREFAPNQIDAPNQQSRPFIFFVDFVILRLKMIEYGNIDSVYGPAAKTYINWAATMALSLDTGVPWVMCQQADALDPIINTCNGFYCDNFTPNSDKKPKMWTENWSGWFLPFGGPVPYRPAEDLAFAVACFYQQGGTFQNYLCKSQLSVALCGQTKMVLEAALILSVWFTLLGVLGIRPHCRLIFGFAEGEICASSVVTETVLKNVLLKGDRYC
ncbi:hypothetical protein EZV62_008119 [Acer yangbiense]|uniref:beta-galactosidase n=1 Tax=Acer yangbiense TaxID=1000413 RepID=A0A5C7ICG1_9ROSI|nr:hypothetical protein EZV62_008119 [Acer yangbiense]